jgi:DNA mismatch repair ATPase MutS
MLTNFTILLATVALYILWHYKKYHDKKEVRSKIKRNWGKPNQQEHTWDEIRLLNNYLKRNPSLSQIDEATWKDLNLDEIFKKIDHTVSPVGGQVLYAIIRSPLFDQRKLEERKKFSENFYDESFRLELQLELHSLNNSKIWRLPDLLYNELPEIPFSYNFLLLSPVIAVLCVILGFLNQLFFAGLVIIPILNLIIQYIIGGKINHFASILSGISPLISQATSIGKVDSENENQLGFFGHELRNLSSKLTSLKKVVHIYLHEGNKSSLNGLLWDYLNLLLLIKINFFPLSVKNIARNKETLKNLYWNIGYLDAMISLASLRTSLSTFCYPNFTDDTSQLIYKNVYHPLLENPVMNTIEIRSKGILITGSNMAGKTTFLKTIGVNQIFSQTLSLCFAEQVIVPFCGVNSSMRLEDNLQGGKSLYMSEVDRVKVLIDKTKWSKHKNLYLLDEIFRGTNTIERISASLEVLKWLKNKSNFVLASTHDLELIELLKNEFEFYHFTGNIDELNINFDYKVKKGYSSTRNAIKLLEMSDYPDRIVTNAMKIAKTLEKQGTINLTTKSKKAQEF